MGTGSLVQGPRIVRLPTTYPTAPRRRLTHHITQNAVVFLVRGSSGLIARIPGFLLVCVPVQYGEKLQHSTLGLRLRAGLDHLLSSGLRRVICEIWMGSGASWDGMACLVLGMDAAFRRGGM